MRSLSLALMGLTGALVLAPAVQAQSAASSDPKKADAVAPAVSTSPDEGVGTTIIGDHESPIGLYLTPWKNEYAQRGMDRPAQIVQEQMAPIDPGVFRRQNSYYDTITSYRQAELGAKK
ncbi:MAG: hypothetical protein ACHQIO_02070 [Nevskiales bacterium]